MKRILRVWCLIVGHHYETETFDGRGRRVQLQKCGRCGDIDFDRMVGESPCDLPTKGGARYNADHWPEHVALCPAHRTKEAVLRVPISTCAYS